MCLLEDGFDDDYLPPKPKKEIGCHDGMCGALDCPRCHPENEETKE